MPPPPSWRSVLHRVVRPGALSASVVVMAFALMRLRLDPCPPDEGVPRSIIPARLQFGDADLPVLVLTAPGPATATGEDVVELQAPGNPHLLARIIDALIEVGTDAGLDVRLAEAGEVHGSGLLQRSLFTDGSRGCCRHHRGLLGCATAGGLDVAHRAPRDHGDGTV